MHGFGQVSGFWRFLVATIFLQIRMRIWTQASAFAKNVYEKAPSKWHGKSTPDPQKLTNVSRNLIRGHFLTSLLLINFSIKNNANHDWNLRFEAATFDAPEALQASTQIADTHAVRRRFCALFNPPKARGSYKSTQKTWRTRCVSAIWGAGLNTPNRRYTLCLLSFLYTF